MRDSLKNNDDCLYKFLISMFLVELQLDIVGGDIKLFNY